MEIIHDPGRGVPQVKAVFRDTDKLNLRNMQGGRVDTSFFCHKKREGRVVASGQFVEKGLPGRVDTSGTKKTIETGKLWPCDLP